MTIPQLWSLYISDRHCFAHKWSLEYAWEPEVAMLKSGSSSCRNFRVFLLSYCLHAMSTGRSTSYLPSFETMITGSVKIRWMVTSPCVQQSATWNWDHGQILSPFKVAFTRTKWNLQTDTWLARTANAFSLVCLPYLRRLCLKWSAG